MYLLYFLLVLLFMQLPLYECYTDCRDLDFDESTVSSVYTSIKDFKQTANGKSCRIQLDTPLAVITTEMLDATPKTFFIRRIILANNSIESIDAEPFGSSASCLIVLDLSYNRITDINKNAFKELKLLRKLDLSNNKLKELDGAIFAPLVKLDALYLKNNALTKIKNLTLTNLTMLNLYGNELQLQSGMFKNLTSLDTLNLEWNKIPYIPLGTFQGLVKLETLLLGNNELTAFVTGVFSNLKQLKELDLKNNFLHTDEILNEKVFLPISTITTLIIDGNKDLKTLNITALNYIFHRLLYLGINNMSWSCDHLLEVAKKCKQYFIDISTHTSIINEHVTNIHGVPCYENTTSKITTPIPKPLEHLTITTAPSTAIDSSTIYHLKLLCAFLIVLVIVLLLFILLKDRFTIYRRNFLNKRCISNYKNGRHNLNTEEPECNLDLVTDS